MGKVESNLDLISKTFSDIDGYMAVIERSRLHGGQTPERITAMIQLAILAAQDTDRMLGYINKVHEALLHELDEWECLNNECSAAAKASE
jgi:predicted Zn-dependent protease with MMP-like domain